MRPWLFMVGASLLQAAPVPAKPPPRLRIQPHTVRPRYAYRLGASTLRVQRDCRRTGHILLRLRIRVINRGTRRIELPVLLEAGLATPGAHSMRVPVPSVAPGGNAWMQVDVPDTPQRGGVHRASLRVALSAAGKTWNRLSLPAPSLGAPCHPGHRRAAPHAVENVQ